jgi:response regulator RpfG family c-di-GMP phosphodiesterase
MLARGVRIILGEERVCAMGRKRWRRLLRAWLTRAAVLFLLMDYEKAWGQAPRSKQVSQSPAGDLIQVSIENLMNMEVSSASKKDQKLLRTAAAVFILTQEDIRPAHAMKGDREKCIAGGMDGYLTKPIRPQELDELLESYVARKRGASKDRRKFSAEDKATELGQGLEKMTRRTVDCSALVKSIWTTSSCQK